MTAEPQAQPEHYPGCWRVHFGCAIDEAQRARNELRTAERKANEYLTQLRTMQAEVGRLQQVAETLAAANGVLQAENERLQARLDALGAMIAQGGA